MEQDYEYKKLNTSDLSLDLFSHFDRFQEVTRCWRFEKDKWLLKDIAFKEQWDKKDYESLTEDLKGTLAASGVVIGVFKEGKLVGFSSVENERLGSKHQYLQLSSLHISYGYRHKGLGKKLFDLSSREAKKMGAEKLYISAHSSEETIAFYKNVGCKEAEEYSEKLVADEPFDCQLEYKV
ncbi:Ribosomal protein S18 acetylase RimI [Alkalibacterium subtropicum]|uniref:Ribosomal protein S18 acetylase RimI n=1 Tax=Alkalibacterium subtropicum TaxID=753702 RepID=A0A1I1HHS6_9LACT|nr:GNAT family N-acetyltransferase [Alkalibacterium subtropicum]SFC23366.1 Ribosomal protein S18 acetylase RimI [Alkalibacterium subtropicum]